MVDIDFAVGSGLWHAIHCCRIELEYELRALVGVAVVEICAQRGLDEVKEGPDDLITVEICDSCNLSSQVGLLGLEVERVSVNLRVEVAAESVFDAASILDVNRLQVRQLYPGATGGVGSPVNELVDTFNVE